MKANQFFLSLFFVLAFCEISMTQSYVGAKAAQIGCPYPECQQLFEGIQAQYLPLANELCRDIFMCVTCCNSGYETYVLVRVQPNAAGCRYVEKAEQVGCCSFKFRIQLSESITNPSKSAPKVLVFRGIAGRQL